jgi:hypothetical protein
MSGALPLRKGASAIAEYKKILKTVLENRPSGTRQRLATALGKNRSFVSQIANPAYTMPIPAQHLDLLFELCHFSQESRVAFLRHYEVAHPGKLRLVSSRPATRRIALDVPDLGDPVRNAIVDEMLGNFSRSLNRLIDDLSSDEP